MTWRRKKTGPRCPDSIRLQEQIDILQTRLTVFEGYVDQGRRRALQQDLRIAEQNRKIDKLNKVHGA